MPLSSTSLTSTPSSACVKKKRKKNTPSILPASSSPALHAFSLSPFLTDTPIFPSCLAYVHIHLRQFASQGCTTTGHFLHLWWPVHENSSLKSSSASPRILHSMPYNYYSYWSDYYNQYLKAQRLEQEKRELERRLAEKTRAAQVSSRQISTLGYKVHELERQNNKLSGDLAKQREDTRKAGLLFMEAADRYQQVTKRQIRAKVAELEDTRKASLLLMNAADTYQDVAKKQTKVKVEELEDTRKAVLVLMSAADAYQQEANKQIKEKVEELKILGAQKAKMDARIECLESALNAAVAKNKELEVDRDDVKDENKNLRSEVERLMMQLEALMEKGEAAPTTFKFDAEKAEITKELELGRPQDEGRGNSGQQGFGEV